MDSTSSVVAYASETASASLFTTSMPLTTIFTPALSCSDRPFTYWTDDGTTSTFWRDMYIEDDDCYPYGYAYQHDPTVSAVYSPGVCPDQYFAAQYTADGPTGAQTSWCCPSGMTYGSYACQSLVTSTTQVVDGSSTFTMTDPFIAADWYIQAAWAQTDLDDFEPASAPILTATSTSASSITSAPSRIALGSSGPTDAPQTPTGTATSSTSSSSSSPTPGLSTGAKAGIGVGVALGAIAIVGAIAFFVLRRRRKNRWSAAPTAGHGDTAYGQDVKYGYLHSQPAEIHEAGGIQRPAEAPGDNARLAPTEIEGREYKPVRAELEGDQARGRYG